MTLDGTYTATVDRIVEGTAVVLVEGDTEPVAQRDLAPDRLPMAGRREDAVLRVTFEAGELTGVTVHPDEAERRLRETRERFDRLSKRPPKKDDE